MDAGHLLALAQARRCCCWILPGGETASSFLCVIGSSWILLPFQSCCPALGYCFCDLFFSPAQVVKLLCKTGTLSAPKILPMSLLQPAPSIFLCTAPNVFCLSVIQVSHRQSMSTSLLFQKSLYHKTLNSSS